MGLIGVIVASLLGWSKIDAIFLGAMLAISSTTIIVKAFEESSAKSQFFATLVYGILIIEDLFAILILTLLATFASGKSLDGLSVLKQVGQLLGFLAVLVPAGLWFMPRFLRWLQPYLNDESRIVMALGLCLGLALLSYYAGFSPALGAFLMGAFVSETNEGEKIERLLMPVRDLFGAIFFTSIGMLVDIHAVISELPLIALLSAVTVVGKCATTYLGARLTGQDKRVALQSGLSLAQIGEFSFIIATLGLSLKVVRPDLYPLAVSVSLVTTFLTPYFISYASRMSEPSSARGRRRNESPKLWHAHLAEFEVHSDFKGIGETLERLKLREKFGLTVVSIERGSRKILVPTKDETVQAYDRILVFGEDQPLTRFEKHLHSERHQLPSSGRGYGLAKVSIGTESSLLGVSIRNSRIRESVDGLVLGIERAADRRLNPESATQFELNDVVWIYGDLDRLKSLRSR